jgi:hypothetical protein
MNSKLVLASVAALSMAAPPAFAAGNAQSGATVGDCISDGFYGNEPNMADGTAGGPAEQAAGSIAGNVLPSQSPGPFVTNPDGSVTRGNSIGYYNSQGVNIPELCRIVTGSQ